MKVLHRRQLLQTVAVAATAPITLRLARAQAFPSRPITIVVPFAPGTGSDVLARLLGQRLSTAIGQSVIIDNRVGANGVVAARYVARANPDGYTLFFATNTAMSANPFLMRDTGYDPVKDFRPISRIGTYTFFLAVNPGVPAKSVKELLQYAKANPGKLTYGSGFSMALIVAETIKRSADVDFAIIPYKGGGPINDVIAGHVSMMLADVQVALPHVQKGSMRALAITGKQRSSVAPDIPTLAEEGLAEVDMITGWAGLFAPASTPNEIVNRLNAEARRIVDDPEMRSRVALTGFAMQSSTPEELRDWVQSQLIAFGNAVKRAGLEPE
jgi:tripartite-type tricarboxylate transporter receptor subunit TctC